jgi:hypothetical protein
MPAAAARVADPANPAESASAAKPVILKASKRFSVLSMVLQNDFA